MGRYPTLNRAWRRDLVRPTIVAFVGFVAVGVLALVTQVLARSPLLPGLEGIFLVLLGFLPEMGSIGLPVALLFGTTTVARQWREGGELIGLSAAGAGGRTMLPPLLLTGALGGLLVAALAHGPGPWGRALVRDAMAGAASSLRLEAGRPTQVGDLLIRVGGIQGPGWSDVFVAQGDVVASAPAAQVLEGGTLQLTDGTAMGLDEGGERSWWMTFERAHLSLVPDPVRSHAFEMSHSRLSGLVERMQARGRSAHAEQLILYKRTTLALGVPLLVLFGWPLGARIRRPGGAVVATVVGLWIVQRVGDHAAAMVGAGIAALVPLVFLSLVTAISWWTWRDR